MSSDNQRYTKQNDVDKEAAAYFVKRLVVQYRIVNGPGTMTTWSPDRIDQLTFDPELPLVREGILGLIPRGPRKSVNTIFDVLYVDDLPAHAWVGTVTRTNLFKRAFGLLYPNHQLAEQVAEVAYKIRTLVIPGLDWDWALERRPPGTWAETAAVAKFLLKEGFSLLKAWKNKFTVPPLALLMVAI